MNKVISINEMREMSYCDQCGEPALVVVLQVRGWKYKFRLCQVCVAKELNSQFQSTPIKEKKE